MIKIIRNSGGDGGKAFTTESTAGGGAEWEAYLDRAPDILIPSPYRPLRLPNPFPGAAVGYRAETGSTMEDIRVLARAGAPSGSVVVASFQKAGRGRGGRKSWSAPAGSSLLFSFWLSEGDLPGPASSLPLRLALAGALLLEQELQIRASIKWPNDLLVGGRKICGILCETKGSESFVGIGLNCNQTGFPGELSDRATSILLERGVSVAIPPLLPAFLDRIRASLAERGWREKVEARLYGLGRLVRVRNPLAGGGSFGLRPPPEKGLEGAIRGIGAGGELLVETEAGKVIGLLGGEIGLTGAGPAA